MKNKIYEIDADKDLDVELQKLRRTFTSGEKVVATGIYKDKFIITTESPDEAPIKNLLLEELRRNKS
jgi:hypothetical protein